MSRNQNEVPNRTTDLPRLSEEEMEFFKSSPSGYRFWPTDTQLILDYLHKKVHHQPLPLNRIMNVDLYKFNPGNLADIYKDYGEGEWYFFTPRDKNNRRLRASGDGYWIGGEAAEPIRHNSIIIGRKNTFIFYIGKHPNGSSTDWIMNEFILENPPPAPLPNIDPDGQEPNPELDDCVLCQIYKECARFFSEDDEPESPRAEEIDDNNEFIGDDFEPESPPPPNDFAQL
ncbi:NAC transcription factor 32-like [Mercurialis annua]|uniref:NAC transcription factor 32-like n=1 Tax=Mercurialis annua TaxID=3986 RepID=UPI00216047C4|nr:NAC transcription factor 32-like [Mercurialis annua]